MNRWTPFEWVTAMRFLREGRMQTLLILSGVAIGVGVIVFMSAMLSSLQDNFVDRVLSAQPHIQILPPTEVARPLREAASDTTFARVLQRPSQRVRSISQWQTILRTLRSRADITQSTPTVTASALALRGGASRSITLTGVDPDIYFRIVPVPEYIVLGAARVTSEDIVIGTQLAEDLGVTVGEKVNVSAPNATTRALTVSGIFDLGNKGANTRSTYVALRTAQALAGLSGGVTSIDITVNDLYAAEVIATSVSAATGVKAESWISTNAQLFSTLSAQAVSFATIQAFVALSVALGMASVLIVSVIQRAQDIGILRAMGGSQQQILRVFLLQGALLGIGGASVGAGLGAGSLYLFHRFVRLGDGGELFPFAVSFSLVLITVAIAAVVGVAAAAAPAVIAARLDPVVAIRG